MHYLENTFTILNYTFYIALLASLIGYIRTVWFISIGYTLSVFCMSLFLLFFHTQYFNTFNWLQISLLGIWSFRLGSFLIKRELNSNYTKTVKDQTDASQNQSFFVKSLIWIGVCLLYVMMFSPAVFTLQEPLYLKEFNLWIVYFGVFIMASGLGIEALADRQK